MKILRIHGIIALKGALQNLAHFERNYNLSFNVGEAMKAGLHMARSAGAQIGQRGMGMLALLNRLRKRNMTVPSPFPNCNGTATVEHAAKSLV